MTIADLQTDAVKDGREGRRVAGILSSVTRRMTKDGKAWAQVTLEDLEGSVEVLFFPAVLRPGRACRSPRTRSW